MISQKRTATMAAPTTLISLAHTGFAGLALADLRLVQDRLPAEELVLPTGYATPVTAPAARESVAFV